MFQRKPTFTSRDEARLRRFLVDPGTTFRWPTFAEDLQRKLDGGRTVEPLEIPTQVVTMHSLVRVRNLTSGFARFLVVVFPDEADLRFGRISVLSEVGTALLGSMAGERLHLTDVQRQIRLRLERVISQPEASTACAVCEERSETFPRRPCWSPSLAMC